jgi:hypothetical protein
METTPAFYEAPVILESFDAFEVMGVGEGLEVFTIGCGSQVTLQRICLPQ